MLNKERSLCRFDIDISLSNDRVVSALTGHFGPKSLRHL